jgi:hypothetical protein
MWLEYKLSTCTSSTATATAGWTDKGGNYIYTVEKSISTSGYGELSHNVGCRCLGKISLRTPEESEYFLKRTRMLVGQLGVVLVAE